MHIGRHKTGTTAIQKLLVDNPRWLSEQGYYLPHTGFDGIAHHSIAQSINRSLPAFVAGLNTPAVFTELRAELEQQSRLTAIITSEAFQGRKPQLVRRYLGKLETRVIVYIRNQLDYLVSSYNQRVHATDYAGSIERYYATIFSVNYARFLGSWQRHFPDQLTVRKFERAALHKQDVVADFIKYGLQRASPSPDPALGENDPNPSLNSRVLLFKLHLNRSGQTANFPDDKLYRALPRLNARFEAEKFSLPEKLKAKVVRAALRPDRIAARRFFGEQELFDYADYRCAGSVALASTDIVMMTEALLEELGR